jgi:DNA polymerase-3 subunit delta
VIIKSYEIEKINTNKDCLVLFYGKNDGLKNEAIEILNKNKNNISNYEEKEILDNENNFIETILSKSLFDPQKFIVIKRATDKILKIIENLQQKNSREYYNYLKFREFRKKIKIKIFF